MKNAMRFPGISRHAKALGVSRNHLFLVLSKKRESARLLARYRVLLASEKPNTLSPGTIFTAGSREANAQLAAEYPEAILNHGEDLEVVNEIILHAPRVSRTAAEPETAGGPKS